MEGYFSNPIKKFLDKATEIRKSKPSEYDGSDEIKKFIDKYYNDIMHISEILEKEPDKIRHDQIKDAIGYIVGFIGGLGIMGLGNAIGQTTVAGAVLVNGGALFMVLSFIAICIHIIILAIRSSNDIKASNELIKVRSALKKINISNLPKEYKIKISEMIDSIDAVQIEINEKLLVSKESTDDLYTEGFTKEVSKTYRDSFNEATAKIKEAKKYMKNNDYTNARISLHEANKKTKTAQEQINEMAKTTNLPDNIIGLLYGCTISLIKALIFAVPTMGASFLVASIKTSYTSANNYYEKIKNKEKLDSTVINSYLNHVNHVLNEVIRTINKLEAEISKKESSPSKPSKPEKDGKLFKKKDKNINESTSTRVLLASDLLGGMDDLI